MLYGADSEKLPFWPTRLNMTRPVQQCARPKRSSSKARTAVGATNGIGYLATATPGRACIVFLLEKILLTNFLVCTIPYLRSTPPF